MNASNSATEDVAASRRSAERGRIGDAHGATAHCARARSRAQLNARRCGALLTAKRPIPELVAVTRGAALVRARGSCAAHIGQIRAIPAGNQVKPA